MKKHTLVFISTLCVMLVFASFFTGAEHGEATVDESRVRVAAPAPVIDAAAWGVYDTVSGSEIVSHKRDAALPIASITKLIAADVAVREYDLASSITVTQEAVATEGRAGRLQVGDVLTVRQLLFPLLLESSNDAATALTLVRSDPSFIEHMNTYVHELGLTRTTFSDASGLSAENVSSVHDIARFVTNIKHTNHYILDISRISGHIIEGHTWQNNSHIYKEEGYHGGKHGYIPESGRTLVAVFEEVLASGEMREVTYVLLNSEESERELARLRDFVQAHVTYE